MTDERTYLALDFETADYGRDSACSIGLVRVEAGEITRRTHWLIRPPRPRFEFTYLHGIGWEQVKHEPNFAELWPKLAEELKGVDALVAHNAGFDAGVLKACCAMAGLPAPQTPFLCTMVLARKAWKLFPTKLPDVCRHIRFALQHHHALSDAEACAQVILTLQRTGGGGHLKLPSDKRDRVAPTSKSPRTRGGTAMQNTLDRPPILPGPPTITDR